MRRRRRRLRRKEIRKQRTMFVLSLFGATFLLASAYAAFSTSLNIDAKGNLKEKANTTIGDKKVYLSTTGDGLYTDPVEQNRYVYKGANPDNYICLESGSGTCSEENLYRIIAKETDGTLKVIKNTSIGSKVWDPGYETSINEITEPSSTNGTRYSSNSNDYCYLSSESSYYGCNFWASATTTINSNNLNITSTININNESYNLPEYPSYINIYLNGGTYPTINGTTTLTGWYNTNELNNTIKSKIDENHLFNIGRISNLSHYTSLNASRQDESLYKWRGTVGLMSENDYLLASTNNMCTNLTVGRNNSNCYNNINSHNWLFIQKNEWTISSLFDNHINGFIYSNGGSDYYYSGSPFQVRPVFFLKSSISLTGKGSNDSNVYRIL